MKRVQAILTTTQLVPAYGGTRLPLYVLEALAEGVRTQAMPMRLNHDPLRTFHVENVDAGVRQRTDGEYEVWAEFDVDEADWAEFEAERDALGVAGGMSFSYIEIFDELRNETGTASISIDVAADAHHFSNEQILAAAREFADAGTVKAGRLYQFGAVPTAVVLIQFLLQEGAQVPPAFFAAWLYDALRHFRRPQKASPAVTLEVNEGAEGRKVVASIPAGIDPSIAEKAITAFESMDLIQKSHSSY
jgi:hypothetical protein